MRYLPSSSRRSGQGGAALVVALLIFALSTALIVAMKSEFNLFYQRGANLFMAEQAYAYLRGAEDLAALALVADFDEDQQQGEQRDDLTEIWAQTPPPYTLDDGAWMEGALQDLQARFNLNHLVPAIGQAGDNDGSAQQSRFTAAQQQFIRLLQLLDNVEMSEYEAIQITESIGDWLDKDMQVTANGAEDDFYYARTPAHRAANRPMSSVSELLAVANVTPQLYCSLKPLVTVWPQSPEPMNILTAQPLLLRTINSNDNLTPLSETDAAIISARAEEPAATVGSILADPALADANLGHMASLLSTSSSWFLLSARAEVAERTSHLYSVLRRNNRSIEAVSRYGAVAEPICARLAREAQDDNEDGDGTA
jgi:general secretion pathway protein K